MLTCEATNDCHTSVAKVRSSLAAEFDSCSMCVRRMRSLRPESFGAFLSLTLILTEQSRNMVIRHFLW